LPGTIPKKQISVPNNLAGIKSFRRMEMTREFPTFSPLMRQRAGGPGVGPIIKRIELRQNFLIRSREKKRGPVPQDTQAEAHPKKKTKKKGDMKTCPWPALGRLAQLSFPRTENFISRPFSAKPLKLNKKY